MAKLEAYPDRRKAEVGEPYALKNYAGKPFITGTVKPKTEGQAGQWCCISCGVVLGNNLEKDIHCGRPRARNSQDKPGGAKAPGQKAKHVLAWRSFDSGEVEVP